jgi:hypothetical protein
VFRKRNVLPELATLNNVFCGVPNPADAPFRISEPGVKLLLPMFREPDDKLIAPVLKVPGNAIPMSAGPIAPKVAMSFIVLPAPPPENTPGCLPAIGTFKLVVPNQLVEPSQELETGASKRKSPDCATKNVGNDKNKAVRAISVFIDFAFKTDKE